MTPKIEIFGQKYAHFGGFEGSFWTILRVKKVVFLKFSKLFWSCLESVQALFSDTYTLCFPQQTFSFGVLRMPYTTKNPQDFDWFQNFTTPVRHMKKKLLLCGGGCCGAYLPFQLFFLKIVCYFFFFFQISLAIRGNDFNFFFSTNKPKIELVGRKWTQKSTLFPKSTSKIWPFWVWKNYFSVYFFEKCRGCFLFFLKCVQL